MAYGFIERMSEYNDDIKTYLAENMLFEAWIVCVRSGDISADDFYEKLEQEKKLKNPNLSDDEIETIECEYFEYSKRADDKANMIRVWKQ